MKISGIYKIQSLIKPERVYIGSSINISQRWNLHLSLLRKNKHHSVKLQRHYNKYGLNDLQFSILVGCDKENLISNEQFFIDSYKPYFNNRPIAESNRGLKQSVETIEKRVKKLKGQKRSLEICQKFSEIQQRIKKPHTKEANKKNREKHLGRVPWNKGKKGVYSDVTLNLMSEKRIGFKDSEETKRNKSKSLMGNTNGKALKGTHYSEERKQQCRDVWVIRKLSKVCVN